MRTAIRIFGIYLKICLLIVVLLFPALAIYDRINPWPAAGMISKKYHGQKRICVGFGSFAQFSFAEKTAKPAAQRSFILIPSVFGAPKIITVIEDQDGKISELESGVGFWVLFSFYSMCWLGTGYFWIRPLLKLKRKN